MPVYECRIAKSDGSLAAERVEAEDAKTARQQLESRGDLVFSVEPLRGAALPDLARLFRRRFTPREFLVFNQELVVLIRAGIPFIRTLDILAGRVLHPGFKTVLMGIKEQIRGGSSIADAMAGYPSYFPELYVAAIRSGERSGNLVEVLSRYIVHLKRVLAVRKKVVSALTYPLFLLGAGLAVILFLLGYVMPTFISVYEDSGTQLPAATQWLIAFIEFFRNNLVLVIAGLAGIALLLRWGYRTDWGRRWWDTRLLAIPFVGAIVQRHYLILMSRTLSTSLAGGIPLVSALSIAAEALTNRVWSRELSRVREYVQEGLGLSAGLARTGLVPQMSIEMVEVGENSGYLVEMLNEVADFHEEELELYLNRLTTWAEPAMLLIMGVVIAIIVVSMYLPIFHLAGTIS